MNIPIRAYLMLLVDYLRPQRAKVIWLILLVLGGIGLLLINPQIMRTFIDSAMSGGALDELLGLAVVFFVFALIQQVLSVLSTYVGQDVGWTATNDLRLDLARHLLHLDLSFHNVRKPGELIERVDGDVTALANFFSQFFVQVVANGVFLVGVLLLVMIEDWRVALIMTAYSMIALMILVRLRNIGVPHWKAASQASADFYGFLEERLGGTQDIRANGAKDYVMLRFYQLLRTIFRKQVKAGMMTNLMVNASFLLIASCSALGFILGAWMYQSGLATFGTVYLIFHYISLIARPIDIITRQMDDLQKAGASVARTKELLAIQPKVLDGEGVDLPAGPLKVAFEDVTFGYGDDESIVLSNITFGLEAGKVLGLLGRTGSGKTTITRLLLRFYDPDSGGICLDAHDLRCMKQSELRQRVGMVTQNVQLLHATVRDNLTFFDAAVPDARIITVLRELGLDRWYQSLPEGLDTILESGGGGLSAGEAQLLAFARIFLREPGLVILDEASSRLDPATETLIERALDKLLQDRTAIIIAHRLHTVQRAHYIMILDEGRILEFGGREALAANPSSRFYQLLQTGLEEVLV